MPIRYKIDVLSALKEHGYNTTRLRREKLLAEGVIQSLREGKGITFQNISKLCELLDCQPGDVLEFVPDDPAIDIGGANEVTTLKSQDNG